MKCVTVLGARPQFVKAAPVSAAMIDSGIDEVLVHTGQHFDYEMSQVFFDELNIPEPKHNLSISGGSHGRMTGRMLEAVEAVIDKESPDCVLVYGDTNSTLSGSLAAAKLHVPVAHMEAGIRSYNKNMPEEINRILTDHVSSLLLCPSDTAVVNLQKEGIVDGVMMVGDVMADAAQLANHIVKDDPDYLPSIEGFDWEQGYDLLTLHRAENTDEKSRIDSIFGALNEIKTPLIFPVHPRTRDAIAKANVFLSDNIIICEPLSYLSMTALMNRASRVFTDSGGLQKEAYWAKKPCITLREETEWVETLNDNANQLVGANTQLILEAVEKSNDAKFRPALYGDGNSAPRCVSAINELFQK
ncbi:MAG: UDP-N-acetylglucosamine 2-epimerase (non-hydrolyzing) [Verrucomicrobiota bacterium]|nr:UDP-N-acetylglucosamine 2-epimerase (non-hydrolyzing) [Verrucomicrobiota bacterium]